MAAVAATSSSISQIAQLLNSGNYSGAFQLANSTGNISLLEHPDTLYNIAPNAFKTQAQFDSFYNAFTPYLKADAGQQTTGAGRAPADLTVWNGGANILGEANQDYTDSAAAAKSLPGLQKLASIYKGPAGGISLGGIGGAGSLNPVGNVTQAEYQSLPDLSRYLSNDKTYEAEHRADNVALGEVALTAVTAGIGAAGGAAALGGAEGVSTPVAAAELGAAEGAAGSALGGKNPLVGALEGGIGGYVGASGLGKTVGTSLGLSGNTATGVGNTLVGAGEGAIGGALSGQGALAGALTGGVTAGVASGLKAEGTPSSLAGIGGKLAGGLVGMELGGGSSSSSSATHPVSVLSSSTPAGGQNVDTLDPVSAVGNRSTDQLITNNNATDAASSSSGSGLGSVLSGLETGLGLDPNNLAGSIGSTLGGLGPYAAIGALGLSQASAGRAQDQNYVNQAAALGQPLVTQANSTIAGYNKGTLSPTDQTVVNTSTQQGQSIIDSANPLSAIAQKAFTQYASGQLSTADQLTLDNQVKAQKAAVASRLQSQGITDSTVLDAQYQQIDNQALQTKQTMLQQQFSLGNQAYDTWLQSTSQGQQEILNGQKFASTELQQSLQNALSEAQIGDAPIMSSIEMAMQSDAQYADQVSQLMGTLASAYAYQQAKKQGISTGSSTNGSGAPAAAGSPPITSASANDIPGVSPVTGDNVIAPGSLQGTLDSSSAGFDNSIADSQNSSLDDFFGGQDSPVSGWLDTPSDGEATLGTMVDDFDGSVIPNF